MQSFRLETLLKLRNAQRRGQQAQLAACQHELAGTQAKQREVAAQLDQAQRYRAILTSEGCLSMSHVRANDQFIQGLLAQQDRLKAEENEFLKQLEFHQERYTEADRDAKVLENLRKRQAAGDACTSARLASRELDQLVQHRNRRTA